MRIWLFVALCPLFIPIAFWFDDEDLKTPNTSADVLGPATMADYLATTEFTVFDFGPDEVAFTGASGVTVMAHGFNAVVTSLAPGGPSMSAAFVDGEIGHVVAYNRALSNNEMRDVENYVRNAAFADVGVCVCDVGSNWYDDVGDCAMHPASSSGIQ